MASKTYSTVSNLRLSARLLKTSLALFMAFIVVSCGSKNENKSSNDSKPLGEISDKADETIQLSELQGLWLVESATDNDQLLFRVENGSIVVTDASSKILGPYKSNKILMTFEINESVLNTQLLNNGEVVQSTQEAFNLDKGKIFIKTAQNKNPKGVAIQRSGQNFVFIERTMRMTIRRITKDELQQLIEKLNVEKPLQQPNPQKEDVKPHAASNSADELIKIHEADFQKPIMPALSQALAKIDYTNIQSFKNKLENSITNLEIIYDSKSFNLGHVFYQQELQCYSGTTLFIVSALKKISEAQLNAINLVVINTVITSYAHVLPGFVASVNGQYHLYGIEMTTSGDGIIDFGITDQIKTPMRVVDALDWIKVETLKDKTENINQLAMQMAEATHKKYKIPLNVSWEKSIVSKPKTLNSSPFSFGEAMPNKKLKRLSTADLKFYSFESPNSTKEAPLKESPDFSEKAMPQDENVK